MLKKLLDLYVYGNVHVALAGFSITMITCLKYDIYNFKTAFFVGAFILISYNFIRFIELKKQRLEWYDNWLKTNKIRINSLTILTIIVAVWVFIQKGLRQESLLLLVPFSVITFFYTIPLFKLGKNEFSFRNFPFIKIGSIAISWAGVSVFFPLVEAEKIIDFNVFLEFFQRFLFVIALTIPFDIRDFNGDDENLKTIPIVFGIRKAKFIGLFLLLVCIVLEFLKSNFESIESMIFILISVVLGFLLWRTPVGKSRYYTAFWVEAIPIVWLLLVVINKGLQNWKPLSIYFFE